MNNDAAELVKHLELFAWYKQLDRDERDTIDELRGNGHACEAVKYILDEWEKPDSPWKKLTDDQMKAQVLGAIERAVGESNLREGLNNLNWYQKLAANHNAQHEVLQTVLNMMRIGAAMPRTARRVDEKAIAASNPWSALLQRHRRP
jgi:hypothetical protein